MILSAVCCKQFIDKLLTQHKTIVKVKFLSKCNSNFNQIFFKKLKKKWMNTHFQPLLLYDLIKGPKFVESKISCLGAI